MHRNVSFPQRVVLGLSAFVLVLSSAALMPAAVIVNSEEAQISGFLR